MKAILLISILGIVLIIMAPQFFVQKNEIEFKVGDCIGGADDLLKIHKVNKKTITVIIISSGKLAIVKKENLIEGLDLDKVYLYSCDETGDEI